MPRRCHAACAESESESESEPESAITFCWLLVAVYVLRGSAESAGDVMYCQHLPK